MSTAVLDIILAANHKKKKLEQLCHCCSLGYFHFQVMQSLLQTQNHITVAAFEYFYFQVRQSSLQTQNHNL
jgi:hypothetical protein